MTHQSTILIADDSPQGQTLLKKLLANEGYNLVVASDGIETLAKAAQLTPDLILLDVMMPNMNGFEVCQRLRANPLLAEVPVIMVTALDDRDSRLHGLEMGADDFITKPFDHVELVARVRTITRINRYRHLMLERAKFQWVVENTDDGYLVVNSDDDVLYANPQARQYLGLSPDQDEMVSEPFLVLADKRYQRKPETGWQSWPQLPADSPPCYLMHPESASNRAFWLQVDLFPAEPNRSWIIRLRDVTKQVNLQRDMRGFHEVVSHKLLTPILGMQVGLEMLARHAANLSTEEVMELAAKGLKNVERLESQIRDVLQYLSVGALARAETGFEVGRLAQVATDISMALELKKVTVTGVEALREARLTLSAQAVELVLREVLENAKKFHPHQSPAVEISIKQNNAKELCLTISDDGLILSPEQLTQAWNPYYQGEKDFTGEVSGMGLGLSMVASLIWGSGGTGRLYNREEGPGVVVELILPLAEKLPEI